MLRTTATLAIALFGALPALAQSEPAKLYDQNVFVMGGPFSTGYFSDILQFYNGQYDSNVFIGGGYQRFIYNYGSFQLGVEAGVGLRLGTPSSAEAWFGGVTRFQQFEVGPLNITPALTAGFSVVSDTIGAERERAIANNAPSMFLYYLGPEIAVSVDSHPEWEAFGRIQHRSGGFGSIANLDGSNAATLGIRYKF